MTGDPVPRGRVGGWISELCSRWVGAFASKGIRAQEGDHGLDLENKTHLLRAVTGIDALVYVGENAKSDRWVH